MANPDAMGSHLTRKRQCYGMLQDIERGEVHKMPPCFSCPFNAEWCDPRSRLPHAMAAGRTAVAQQNLVEMNTAQTMPQAA